MDKLKEEIEELEIVYYRLVALIVVFALLGIASLCYLANFGGLILLIGFFIGCFILNIYMRDTEEILLRKQLMFIEEENRNERLEEGV